MTARELSEILMQTPEAVVNVFDPDTDAWHAVTGLVLSADESQIKLYADEP